MAFERLDSPGNVIAIRLTGKVTGEDIAQYQNCLLYTSPSPRD